MLRSIRDLHGSTASAVDGDIRSVVQAYLDDESWDVRYPVVETGSWLNERQVLISPYSVKHTDPGSDIVHVDISRQQVRDSPMLRTHKPVSRQHEIDYLRYYSYPAYWGGPKRWGMGAYPAYDPSGVAPGALLDEPTRPTLHRSTPPLDVHLRSTDEIKGYHVKTADGGIGHVADFIYDDVGWLASTVSTTLTRDVIRPVPAMTIPRRSTGAMKSCFTSSITSADIGRLTKPRSRSLRNELPPSAP